MSDAVWNVVLSLGVPAALGLAWLGIGALKQRGYRTAYAEALLRAVGAGALAAKDAGTTIFTPNGREIAIKEGVEYLFKTVPDTAKALEIDGAGHELRVKAQIGVETVKADAAANAALYLSSAASATLSRASR